MSLLSLPSLPSSPRIVIAYVTDVGEAAVANAGETHKLFNCRRGGMTCKNTVCVIVNTDKRAIIGVKILGSDFYERPCWSQLSSLANWRSTIATRQQLPGRTRSVALFPSPRWGASVASPQTTSACRTTSASLAT